MILLASSQSQHIFSFSNLLRKELTDYDKKFIDWAMQNQANYLTVEELNFRKALFVEDQARVDMLNQNQNDTATYTTNKYSDWTQAEKNSLLGHITANFDKE